MHSLLIGFGNHLSQVDSWIFIRIILFPIRGAPSIVWLTELSHPEFHKNNFDHIIRILLDNVYPLNLIFTSIRRRLYTRSHTNRSKDRKEMEKLSPLYFTIPYVSSIANKFIQFFKNITFCKLAFSCYNKLNRFIKIHKDVLPISSLSNVVYQINCLDCDATYVG